MSQYDGPVGEWFSMHVGIELPQYALPFIDFDIHGDVPLYIDSYAITKDTTPLGVACHNAIISYFQALLDAIKRGDNHRVTYLIRNRLREPKEIYLGVGKSARKGMGLGSIQEAQIVDALTNSGAIKSGLVKDIQELELHIDGLGPDKMSDLVANIIKGDLATFTKRVCDKFGVSTRARPVSGFWNTARLEWDSQYFDLPGDTSGAYILVPRQFVRREQDTVNHQEFYDDYVLEQLEREMISANDSLVHTLKNGQKRVYKKDIKADPRFRNSKAFISQFIETHPDLMEQYRRHLMDLFAPQDPALYSGRSAADYAHIQTLADGLKALTTGRSDATTYHRTIFELLAFVFDYALQNFTIEQEMDQGRGRIDIICDNYASDGFFADVKTQLNANSIPIECKNYGADLGNNEFNQISDRMGATTSRLGFLFCRIVADKEAMSRHATDRYLRQGGKVILLFSDEDVARLVRLRLANDYQSIEALLREKRRRVEYGTPE